MLKYHGNISLFEIRIRWFACFSHFDLVIWSGLIRRSTKDNKSFMIMLSVIRAYIKQSGETNMISLKTYCFLLVVTNSRIEHCISSTATWSRSCAWSNFSSSQWEDFASQYKWDHRTEDRPFRVWSTWTMQKPTQFIVTTVFHYRKTSIRATSKWRILFDRKLRFDHGSGRLGVMNSNRTHCMVMNDVTMWKEGISRSEMPSLTFSLWKLIC